MSRKVFSIMMVFAICLHTGGKPFLYFWYQVSNGSFTKAFCINQKSPVLHCNGKCYLSYLLRQQQEEQQKQVPNPTSEEENRAVYDVPLVQEMTAPLFVKYHSESITYKRSFWNLLLAHAFFHPPCGATW